MLSRRHILTLAAGAGVSGWVRLEAAEFWDKKQPSEWTVEEVQKLKTKSPWAKEVSATMSAAGGGNRGGAGGGGGMGGPRIGGGIPGIGMGGGRRGGMGGGGRRTGQQIKGTVRWESAQPIVDASHAALPADFANHYVISVSGFPLRQGRRAQDDDSNSDQPSDKMLETLKMYTVLQPKGKSQAQPGVMKVDNGTVLFGFAKDVLNLSADDKEVEFSTQLGRAMIKTKFEMKGMKYRGKLAL